MTDKSSTANLDKFTKAIALKDGSMLCLRAIRADDEDKLLSFFYRLSSRSIYLRFHHVLTNLSKEEAHQYTALDYENTFAVVAVQGEGPEEKIIGVGRYWRLSSPDKAEIAFVIEDPHQRKGIGTHLLEMLAIAAKCCRTAVSSC